MNVKLTIPEKLKDLRVEWRLTLEQLAEATGLSKAALGNYENDEDRDISPFAIVTLARFYGVSTDYLLGLTENKNHPNAELDALHLSDAALEVLRGGRFNHRMLSELICHDKFSRFMVDAEIFVDRIADARINDLNAILEAVRKQVQDKYAPDEDDLHMRTLELAQVKTENYFEKVVSEDINAILCDIRAAHVMDISTADEASVSKKVEKGLQEAMEFEGSPQEKQIRTHLTTLGIDYEALTKDEFVTLIGILSKSELLKNPKQSQCGKPSPYSKLSKKKRR
ncbi:MAG: helix-turn-helix domain-containing protein [Oscillospiraceae bacterium]|nr:helix-turn-helix domain-containing protein [Oscillospiraceae bacterium]